MRSVLPTPPACNFVMISSFEAMKVGWKSMSLSVRNVPDLIGVS